MCKEFSYKENEKQNYEEADKLGKEEECKEDE